uniref:EGF-like domain-containing protein n=1 Tax=Parascaris univalens TaxID=6257 RepID=A0A915BXZ3_PARUN
GLLLLLIAVGNTNVDAFPEGFFTKLTNFFRKKPTPPPVEVSTYQRYDSPDEDLFSNIHSEVNPSGSCPAGQVYVDEPGACMTVQYPSQPCQYSQQCSGAEEGAFCSRLKCECAHGMTISGGSCVFSNHNCRKHAHVWIEELGECKQVILPGSTGCSHSSQCSTAYAGTYCFHQMCTCPPPLYPVDGTCGERCFQGHTYSSITGECLPSVLPGEKCLYSSQCNAMQVGTVCKRGRCRCADGFVFSGTQCAKACPKGFTSNRFGLCRPDCTQNQVEHEGDCYNKMGAGQRCEISAQCSSRSTCIGGICKCPANMIIKSGRCYPKEVLPLDSCAGGEQCSGGSRCSNGKCVCPPGTKALNGQCITPVTVPPNSPCNPSVQCGGGSHCIDSTCECPSSQVPVGDICQYRLSVGAGGLCPTGRETCLGGSSCTNGICQCPFGTVAELGKCATVKAVSAGSPCSPSHLCTGLATCIDGICQCPKGLSTKGGQCRSSSESIIGKSCANGEICTGGSICLHAVCKCPTGTINVNNTCQKMRISKPGKSCDNGMQCTGGSKCIRKVCVCPSNTVTFKGRCFPVSGFSAKCSDSSQCGGGSYCHPKRHVCTCPANQTLVGQKCVASVALPRASAPHLKPCVKNTDCSGGTKCLMKRCRCPAGKIYRNGYCRMVTVRAGSSCASGETCIGDSNCINGMCACSPNESIVNGRCVVKASIAHVGPGENCLRADVKCNEGSVCMNGVCACMTGTILRGGKCRAHVTANPGESCGRGERCEGESLCNRNLWKCVCPMEMIKIGNKCHPRLKSAPGFPCNNGEICIGGSYCQDDTCTCAPSQVRQNRQCVARKRVAPGSRCTSADICIGLSRCIDGFCQCEDGRMERRGECTIVLRALPGDGCSNGEECVGGSKCVGGVCSCPGEMIVYEKECRVQPTSQPGLPCGYGERCIGGSFCDYDRKVCSCPSGFSITRGTCQPPVEAMTIDIQAVELTWNTVPSQISSTAVTSTVNTPSMPTMTSGYATGANRRANLLLETSTQRHSFRRSELSALGLTTSAVSGRERLQHTTHSARSIQPGRCRSDEECSGGTQCAEGYCLCPVHQIMNNGHCQSATTEAPKPKVTTVSRPCVASNQCADGAECISGVCRCPEGTVDSRRGFCIPLLTERKKRELPAAGDFYTDDMDVAILGEVCDSEFGQLCEGNSLCLDGFCQCGEESVQNGTICIPRKSVDSDISTPGDICDDGYFCDGGSFCVDNVCTCPIEMSIYGRICVFTYAKEGESCAEGERCLNYLTCEDGICKCITNASDGNCFKRSHSSDSPVTNCAFDATICEGGTYCLKDVCVCPAGTNLTDGLCTPVTADHVSFSQVNIPSDGAPEPPGSSYSSFKSSSLAQRLASLDYPSMKNINPAQGSAVYDFRSSGNMNPPIAPTYLRFAGGAADRTFDTIGQSVFNNFPVFAANPAMSSNGNIQMVGAGSACIVGDLMLQCAGNSICANGFCTCPNGEQIINGVCVARDSQAAPGQSCQIGVTYCTGGSLCVLNVCTCPLNQVSLNGQCAAVLKARAQTLPNQPCTTASDCADRWTCEAGICKCPAGTFASNGGTACVSPPTNAFFTPLSGAPGQRCGTVSDAAGCDGGSICINGLCICPAGQVISENKCVAYISEVPAGGSCATMGMVCGGGSTCLNGICECAVGSMPQNGLCVPSNTYHSTPILQPGAPCIQLCEVCAQCGGGSVCMNNICTCPIGYFAFRSHCVPFHISPPPTVYPPPSPTVPSYPPINILPVPSYQPPKTTTSTPLILVQPGDTCNVTAICSGGSSCIIGRCVCPPGYVPNFERNSCINALLGPLPAIVTAHPGQDCAVSGVCDGGASCVGGVCSCPSNSYPLSNICVQNQQPPPISYPGSPCTGANQCQLNSKCFNGYCVCLGDLDTNASGFCTNASSPGIRRGLAGSRCSPNALCTSDSLVCSTWGHCICADGLIGNGLGKCSQPVRPPMALFTSRKSGTECSTSSECAYGSECVNGSCTCPAGTLLRSGRCADKNRNLKGSFGMKCTRSNDCKSNYVCNEGRCACPPGAYEHGGECVHRQKSVPPGSWCDDSAGVMCTGGSSCQQNLCVCPGGHLISAHECVPSSNEQRVVAQLGRDNRIRRPQVGIQRCPMDGSCQLPDCYCSRTGAEIPGGYSAAEVPQMVIITFDGPITDHSIKIFKSIFNGRFRNPNGCPIKATFFVSHEWNNYDQSQWLMGNGHEIAVGSMTGDALRGESSERWHAEMVGMRNALRLFSYVPGNEIIGVRAPHLETGGDRQFSMMTSSGFAYDSTMAVSGGPYWPQTLDFTIAWGCSEDGCPRVSHHGLWEIPISRLTRRGHRGEYATLKDALRTGDLPDDIADMLEENFQRHYRYNRAPFVVAINSEYLTSLQDSGAVSALEIFISKVLQNRDAYIVSASQALHWLRLPTRLAKIQNFTSWQCNQRARHHILPCENPSTCTFTCDRGEAHAFRICGSCPRAYPKLGDPTGSGNVTAVN